MSSKEPEGGDLPERMAELGLSVGVVPPAALTAQSGLATVEAMATGALPMPPMTGVLPILPHSWSTGAVEFRAWPEARFRNPMGTMHGGWAMTLLDTAMGIAAHTTLRAGEAYGTHQTQVTFVRPIVEAIGEMRVTGTVLSRGRSVINVEGRLESVAGKLYAHGTGSCLVRAVEGWAEGPRG